MSVAINYKSWGKKEFESVSVAPTTTTTLHPDNSNYSDEGLSIQYCQIFEVLQQKSYQSPSYIFQIDQICYLVTKIVII